MKGTSVDWEASRSLLGSDTDEHIAQSLGVSKATVARHRRSAGIEAFSSQPVIAWERFTHLFGQYCDRSITAIISDDLGATIAEKTVSNHRRKMGIPAVSPLDSKDLVEKMGTVSDRALASEFDLHPDTVSRHRRQRGIPACERSTAITWDSVTHLLGTKADRELADELGVSEDAVLKHRHRQGIPSHRSTIAGPRTDRVSHSRTPVDTQAILKDAGSAPDAQIAQAHGVSVTTVWKLRQEAQIPSYRSSLAGEPIGGREIASPAIDPEKIATTDGGQLVPASHQEQEQEQEQGIEAHVHPAEVAREPSRDPSDAALVFFIRSMQKIEYPPISALASDYSMSFHDRTSRILTLLEEHHLAPGEPFSSLSDISDFAHSLSMEVDQAIGR
jgi:hypothetical protein